MNIKNFRDAGESINEIANRKIFIEKTIYRGGHLNNIYSHEDIFHMQCILNLRSTKDKKMFNCNYLHIPAEDKTSNYETDNPKVKKWVNKVIAKLAEPQTPLPILIHCTSGKDRTGIIIATIFKAFDIPDYLIAKEYLLSEGVDDPRYIQKALSGMGKIEVYLKYNVLKNLQNKFHISKT